MANKKRDVAIIGGGSYAYLAMDLTARFEKAREDIRNDLKNKNLSPCRRKALKQRLEQFNKALSPVF